MSELKPCPFCGATHALTVDNLAGDDWYVECEACKVQQHAIYPTDSAAIAAWNRRASGVAMPAKCEADRVAVMSDKLFEQIEYAVLAKTHTGDGAQLDEAKAKFVQLAASHQRLKEALRNVMAVMPVCPKNTGIAGIEARYNAAVVGAREALRSTP